MINGEDIGNVLNSVFPGTATYGQQYYWRVEAYNSFGQSSGCGTNSFTIMSDPLVGIPFTENFDQTDAFGDREYPLGWSTINYNNDNFPWDLISNIATPDVAHSAPNAMHMLFSLNTASDYLFTPPVSLEAELTYEMSFWYRTVGDQWVPNPVERMKVKLGNNNDSTAMSMEIYKNETIDNLTWAEAKVSFSVENDGVFYFGFYAYSLPNQGLLLLDDVSIVSLTSISENEQIAFSMFPNPAGDKVTVDCEQEIEMLSIFDVGGRLVYRQSYNKKQVSIGIENFENGVYFVTILTSNGMARKKLIVN
jgi:trimeric autotransporter adhesin